MLTPIPDQPSRARLARRYAIGVALVHAVVVWCSLVPGWRAIPLIDADAPTYLRPAENLVAHRVFSADSAPPFLWDGYRTPSYPLLIAASLLLSGRYEWALFFAPLTAGLAAFCGMTWVRDWNGSPRAVRAAGWLFALLPSSLGFSAELLTDAVFGHLVLVWLYLLWTGVRSGSRPRLVLSAAVLLFLQGLKPTFAIAFVLIGAVAVLVARDKRQWLAVGVLLVWTIPVPLFLAARNSRDHGVFSPSLMGTKTVRDYLMARYLAEERGVDFQVMRDTVRENDLTEARTLTRGPSFDGKLHIVRAEKVAGFIREHPSAALRLALVEMGRQSIGPEDRVFRIFIGGVSPWIPRLGILITVVLIGCSAYGGYRLWHAGDPTPPLLALAVMLFFVGTGSVGGLAGARLRFPADLVAVPLAAIGLDRMTAARGSTR